MDNKLKVSAGSFAVLSGTLCILSFCVGSSGQDYAFNLAVLVFGLSFGWVTGIIIAPYSKNEEKQFGALTKAITTFASGYLLGKFDQVAADALEQGFSLNSVYGFRLVAGSAAFVLAATITYVFRKYA